MSKVEELSQLTGLTEVRVHQLLTSSLESMERMLFKPGNAKLSKRILTFGLPAGPTCPGKTELCEEKCYATQHYYRMDNVKTPRLENLVLAHRTDFADLAVDELSYHRQRVVRIHDSGDFFSREYAEAWLAVARRDKKRRFFALTRSWRLDDICQVMVKMSKLKNFRMWYSIDRETGWPSFVPTGVRLAYLQVDEKDVPTRPVDLVFRDYAVRYRPAKRLGGNLVCPYENGVTRVATDKNSTLSCWTCGICWSELGTARDPRRHHDREIVGTRRVSLKLAK